MKKYMVFVLAALLIGNVIAMEVADGMELIVAAKRLDAQKVKDLLSLGTYNVNKKDDEGLTALFHAVRPPFYCGRLPLSDERENQIKIIQLLLEKNAEIEIKTKYGRSMLFFAQQPGWEHVKKALND